MKKIFFVLILSMSAGSMLFAQSSSFHRLFEKYENEDAVTVVSISKNMLNLIPGNIQTGTTVDIKNIVPKIESILLISADTIHLKEKMNADFKSLIEKDKSYEELMRVKSGKSNILFHAKKKGELISELMMLINDEANFVAIQILGNFTLDEIKSIAVDTEKQ